MTIDDERRLASGPCGESMHVLRDCVAQGACENTCDVRRTRTQHDAVMEQLLVIAKTLIV